MEIEVAVVQFTCHVASDLRRVYLVEVVLFSYSLWICFIAVEIFAFIFIDLNLSSVQDRSLVDERSSVLSTNDFYNAGSF